MKTLTIAAATPGAGATTLAALAYLFAREAPTGAPRLHTAPDTDLPDRIPPGVPNRINPDHVVWDAGVLTPADLATALHASNLLALATPATPIGIEDALRHLHVLSNTTGGPPTRMIIVTIGVYGPHHPPVARFPIFHVHLPHDSALAHPGPIPHHANGYSRKTRPTLQQWATLTRNTLGEGSVR